MPDWSKLGRSSRNRGHSFERMIANEMNRMFKTKRFYRTPCSGGQGVEGDIYEAPGQVTEWSNVDIFCRTQVNISLEAFICEGNCQLKRWMGDTGVNSLWIFRNRPGRIFLLTHTDRIVNVASAYATNGDFIILPFSEESLKSLDLRRL